jgi:hypothetical protein
MKRKPAIFIYYRLAQHYNSSESTVDLTCIILPVTMFFGGFTYVLRSDKERPKSHQSSRLSVRVIVTDKFVSEVCSWWNRLKFHQDFVLQAQGIWTLL